ncbi:bifunctional acetyl-CoA hydrolase/transferase family protein/GNAT family N-acetyltransferase [uncultured Paraglaciecola sp.]|uniref:bifunctional acetyl-CoA hydrolase/transferase family protein/GNAT family N-acetyltransferase n=1 Tax=uncultured Paraglaciecola sp. TaxID=1765024 RepID=UPI0025941A85|nr:bifunctional acetyl-CoA hydrolase/transferase family protein/GNAT family N-acetyltransferase [uncultured Paraglaciecola sp.]
MSLVKHQFDRKVDWHSLLDSGNRVFIGSYAAVPNALIDSLIEDAKGLNDIELTHMGTLSDDKWALPEYASRFKVNTFFIHGDTVRQAVDEGRADYTPCFLSEVSGLFTSDTLPLDAALIMVSPPDELGYCSLGVSVDVVMSAARAAKHIIAQVNPSMPRTCGQTFLHISEFSACIEAEQPLPEVDMSETSKIVDRIGQYTAILIDDGATLQLGIGKIPDAVTRYLYQHKNLGIHSELLCDGLVDLIKRGVVTNRYKTFHPGKTVVSFCFGSKNLYDFVDINPHVEFYPSGYVNKPANIAKNDNMVSINSALQVDLSGQVVADSIGYDFYSGIGGQVDFVTGASKSKNGRPIIALPSTAKNGEVSRIVATLSEGSGVVTSRGNVHYVITEFGIASLQGKSVRERALELIRVAHPKFRDELLAKIREKYWVPDYQTRTPTDIPELGEVQISRIQFQDQQFYMRPLNPSDERRLQEFFYSHTKETIRMRYNFTPGQMTREKSCDLVSVDQSKDVALTIVQDDGSKVRIEAVGRYYLYEQQNSCEVAFVTRETNQGKGMASRLLRAMIDIAEKRGLTSMFALVKNNNLPMISVFEQFGFVRKFDSEPGEIELVKRLNIDAVELAPDIKNGGLL